MKIKDKMNLKFKNLCEIGYNDSISSLCKDISIISDYSVNIVSHLLTFKNASLSKALDLLIKDESFLINHVISF